MSSKSEGSKSLIPETYVDYPSQRLYTISVWLLCQTVKFTDFIRYISYGSDSLSLCGKWLLFDTLFITALAFLRIPRLTYSKPSIALIVLGLGLVDSILFGGISLNGPTRMFGSGPSHDQLASTSSFSLLEYVAPLAILPASWTGGRDGHLLGQHTVRMSPISTAKFNPQSSNFCLSPASKHAWIPVLLNNTEVSALRYTHTHLLPNSDGTVKVDHVDMSGRELKAITNAYQDLLQKTKPSVSGPANEEDEYDEYDDDDEDTSKPHSNLQKSQTILYLRISKPGIINLEHVLDTSNVEARISASEVTVVPCPSVAFLDDTPNQKGPDVQCAGQDTKRELKISVHGVPPLSLRWWKSINGNREPYLVEGIEGEHKGHQHTKDTSAESTSTVAIRRNLEPQTLQIPLTLTFSNPGTYVYGLEEIIDGVGNSLRVGADGFAGSTDEAPTRSFKILTRPAVSFAHCSLERPTSLLIGSEAEVGIRVAEADSLDGPWDITLAYQPFADDPKGKNKPWNKVLQTQGERKDLSLSVGTPGEYTITEVKGKYCTGMVLSPNVCKVVQRPRPSAEIEWKRIHECSGDTGVSASLILRGTPPFQVSYRVQRDKEPPREYSKTFTNSRGEITIQPERSGHYIFTFVKMSDANYRRVDLQGPTIEQIIHPLASADFAESHASNRGRAVISSCSGETIDVDVNLRGTGPWNVDVQVIGPESSDVIHFNNIETQKKKLQIPIPPSIARDGGNFEVNLLNVEDVYKCKRSISVPGVTVNVRRTRPTARFYGSDEERRIAPWRIRYRKADSPERILSSRLFNPNDFIHVTEEGTYELVDVTDSQCPGIVASEASNYKVDWIPRPTAKLSPETTATYVAYNHSFVLSPVCEGVSDHVDLDLSGRPPFQIMYNIAQGSENGGTRMLDQPTMNSIQPRTRFQLQTTTPGRMFYEVKQIGDSMYPLDKSANAVIPRLQRLLFEQQVARRPSAHFRNRNRMTYCLNDAFVPLDSASMDGVVVLEGTPPFSLTLSVKNVPASHIETMTVEVPSNVWKVDLPSYAFNSIGAHRITIESVTDSSNCAQSALDPLLSSIWVDVAETAAIIPFDHKQDLCVGEVSQFQLEGIPPWTVGYKVNGKSYTKEVKTSPFSLLQQTPGEFTINSIAHQQQMCKAVVTDLRFNVHSLPSAQVGHGKKIYEDIHEGDQAEIVFTLIGEPPFTFTYQRSEPTPKKGGKPGRVLETHTVTRVMTHEYSIFSALEGTWTITSITDKYCRYPPVQPELMEKQKR
ncbi:hypothetical protein D9611_005631 [Ephemerocybe angulata]|uniref:Uncharacterized protein n=1 Tax=Ephemerocybe angulata TaxID=980116 RepID=A0A8H5BI12_9AGAR|nr:hypothetical protein D9611_005631 [Tulosesus angulatus]